MPSVAMTAAYTLGRVQTVAAADSAGPLHFKFRAALPETDSRPMPEIRELDPETVSQIAAGEVVERPASAVKELVENALDAGATRIDVAVEAGGTERVTVADDGHGMDEAAARAAVREHTTSKIEDIEDLAAGVGSLGFRGEALHTIGAVSRLTLTTRAEGARGVELRYEGGEVAEVRPAGRPVGTTVEVTDLFYNTPARRKYLKAESTEFGRVNRVVSRYALANPDVAVSLTHGDRETFATTGRGDVREAILAVYGREVAEAMVAVEADPDALADTPATGLGGYVSDPETTRSSREYLATFVNGRAVSDPAIREAVLAAYGGQLAPDRFPFAALFLEVDPASVDVNVHPRKMEVRYGDEAGVREAVETVVERALLDAGLVRAGAPRGRSAPDDAAVEPRQAAAETDADAGAGAGADADADGDAGVDPGGVGTGDRTGEGAADRPPADSRSEPEADGGGATAPSPAETDAGEGPDPAPDSTSGSTTTGDTEAAGSAGTVDGSGSESDVDIDAEAPTGLGERDSGGPESGRSGGGDGAGPDVDPERKFRPATRNATLPGTGDGADADADAGEREAFASLPAMRILGQVQETYVLGETEDGLVLIDQHAADERINYERLCERAAAERESQSLVVPVELELTAGEAAVFADALPALSEVGFEARLREADRTAVVGAVPAALGDALDAELLRDLLDAFLEGRDPDPESGSVESAADDLLADLACYPSVTGNTSLTEGSVLDLLRKLDGCENPYACPHGRPVIVEISADELADRFERDYPGHRVRRPEE
jgi:DNA mismatch repair protein MutL